MTPLQRWKIRRGMTAYCNRGIDHEGEIHYSPLVGTAREQGILAPCAEPPPAWTGDCSMWAIRGARCSGAPTPGYPFGNSDSISRDRRRILDIRDVHRGDYIIFRDTKTGRTTHVAVAIDRAKLRWKRNPGTLILCSHGMERGPLRITLANELTYHEGEQAEFYSLLHARAG